jgi:hypothetical protein
MKANETRKAKERDRHARDPGCESGLEDMARVVLPMLGCLERLEPRTMSGVEEIGDGAKGEMTVTRTMTGLGSIT